MKKMLAVCTALVLCASLFTACKPSLREPPSAYNSYEKMYAAFTQAEAVDARTTMVMKLFSKGENYWLDEQVSLHTRLRRGDSPAAWSLVSYGYSDMPFYYGEHTSAYYQDGRHYYESAYSLPLYVEQDISFITPQFGAVDLIFTTEDILSSKIQDTPMGAHLSFELNPKAMQSEMERYLSSYGYSCSGAIESIDLLYTAEQVTFEAELDKQGLPRSTMLVFQARDDILEDEFMLLEVETERLRFGSTAGITFPESLADAVPYSPQSQPSIYDDDTDDVFSDFSENDDTYWSDFYGSYSPLNSEPEIINQVGADNLAANFLAEEANLDYYFWLAYQTQALGSQPPILPAGFDSPANISTEGLVRLFCAANQHQTDAFMDPDQDKYFMPDVLVTSFLDNCLRGYRYLPYTTPSGFVYENEMMFVPHANLTMCVNWLYVERAEVLNATQVKLTGQAYDFYEEEAPINRQELVLTLTPEDEVYFERYTITLP